MKIIRQYGPNKLENSSLCFGTMQFGDGANEHDSQEMYEACRESGINFLILHLFILEANLKKFLET